MLDLNKHNRIITDIWHLKFSEESVKKEDNYFLDFITEAYTEPPPIWEQYISTIEKEEIFHTIYISNEENVITPVSAKLHFVLI